MAHCSKSTQVNSKLEPQFLYQNTINFSTLGSDLNIQLMGSIHVNVVECKLKKVHTKFQPLTNMPKYICECTAKTVLPQKQRRNYPETQNYEEFFSIAQFPVQKWCTWKYTKLSMQAKDQWNRVGQVERSPISSHLWWNQQSGWEQSLVQFHWHVFWVPVLLLMPVHIYPFRSNLENQPLRNQSWKDNQGR